MAEETIPSTPVEEKQDEEQKQEPVEQQETQEQKKDDDSYQKLIQTKHQKMKSFFKENAPEHLEQFEQIWRNSKIEGKEEKPQAQEPAMPTEEEEYLLSQKDLSVLVDGAVEKALSKHTQRTEQERIQREYDKEYNQHLNYLGEIQKEFELTDSEMKEVQQEIQSLRINWNYLGGPTAYAKLFNDKAYLRMAQKENPSRKKEIEADIEKKVLAQKLAAQPEGRNIGLTPEQQDENDKAADAIVPDDVPL